jgi:hypothetical protein
MEKPQGTSRHISTTLAIKILHFPKWFISQIMSIDISAHVHFMAGNPDILFRGHRSELGTDFQSAKQ